jgi:Phosphoenolpyruvate phosphomutase
MAIAAAHRPRGGATDALHTVLARGSAVIAGCHDPLSARVSAAAGADALFLSGGVVGRALFGEPGIPDTGVDDYLAYARIVCTRAPLPVIIDGETGFGDPTTFCGAAASAGAAGVVIGNVPAGTRSPADIVLVPRIDELAASPARAVARCREHAAAGAELILLLMTSLLDQPGPVDGRTVEDCARAAGGLLAVHARTGAEFRDRIVIPAGVRAAVLSAVSLPDYAPTLSSTVDAIRSDLSCRPPTVRQGNGES